MKNGPKVPLVEYAHTEMLNNEPAASVRNVWLKHHSTKSAISAVIPLDTATKLSQRLEDNPDFLIPLPLNDDEGNFMVMYQQSSGNVVQFTSVDEYNRLGANASNFLTLYFYDDLAASKGLVLMRGAIHPERMSVPLSQMLINHLQVYYLSDSHYKFVELFNKTPASFDFDMLMLNTRAILAGAGRNAATAIEVSKQSEQKPTDPAAADAEQAAVDKNFK